jgi:hypothetical protein
VQLLCEFGEKPSPLGGHQQEHLSPSIDDLDVQKLPIVQARTLDEFLIEPKSYRPYNPKLGVQSHAGSTYIPSVLGDFRLIQNDVEGGFANSDFSHCGH